MGMGNPEKEGGAERKTNRDRNTGRERPTHCHSNATRKTHEDKHRKKLGKIHYFRKVFTTLVLQRWAETWVPSLMVIALSVHETKL